MLWHILWDFLIIWKRSIVICSIIIWFWSRWVSFYCIYNIIYKLLSPISKIPRKKYKSAAKYFPKNDICYTMLHFIFLIIHPHLSINITVSIHWIWYKACSSSCNTPSIFLEIVQFCERIVRDLGSWKRGCFLCSRMSFNETI